MTAKIDIRPQHLSIVQGILHEHLPDATSIYVFGSRATGEAKTYSDLDLALLNNKADTAAVSAQVLCDLRYAFEDSDLPYKVDIVDLSGVTPAFRTIVNQNKVALPLGGVDDLPSGWQTHQIGDVIEINPKIKLSKRKSYPFVEMKNLEPSIRLVYPAVNKVFKGSGSKFETGDTLLARITPCLENGKTSQYKGISSSPAWGSTEFIVLREKNGISNNDFIYYFSRLPKFREYAIHHMVGTSGRQRVPNDAIANFTFKCPPLKEQKAIASVLGELDDKIELNYQMNATLEEMTRAIFKSWFVDFDPVHAKMALHNHQPSNQSPIEQRDGKSRAKVAGEPVESDWTVERAKRYLAHMDTETAALFPNTFGDDGLPMGFVIRTLGDFNIELESGKRPKGGIDKSLSEGIPSIGAESLLKIGEFDYSKLKFVKKEFAEKSSKGWVQNYDVAIYKDGANVGDPTRVSLFGNGFPFERFMVNEHVFLIRSKELGQSFLYSLCQLEILSQQLNSMGTSKAAQPGLNQQEVLSCKFTAPTKALSDTFNLTITPLIDQRLALGKENQTLAELRDTLLPQLISGKLSVPEAMLAVEAESQ